MLNLPPADHTPLHHPPLPLVVAQARFSSPVQEVTQDLVARLQGGLLEAGDHFDRVASVEMSEVFLGLGQRPASSERVTGVQLTSHDRSWMVTLMPASASLETPSFSELCRAVRASARPCLATGHRRRQAPYSDACGPAVCQCLASSRRCWWMERWVRSSLLAAHNDDVIGMGVVSQTQQLLFDVATGVRSAVQAGGAEIDGDEGFLLDIDTFTEPSTLWALEDVMSGFELPIGPAWHSSRS